MNFTGYLADLFARSALALGYDAAENTRHRNNLAPGRRQARSEDSLMGYRDREMIRQQCLNLRRNDPIVAGVVERFADNVVGSGIIPQAKTGETSWDTEAEAFYREWCKVCDSRQRVNMREMQRGIVSARMLTGDMGFILTDGGQLQPIEAERIKTPDSKRDQGNIVDGVAVDPKTGVAAAYYVYNRTSDGRIDTSTNDYNEIPAANFFFVASPFRFDQLRGVPDLAPIINPLRDLHDFVQATLEKARLDAHTGLVVTTDDNRMGPGNLGSRLSTSGANGIPQYERFETGQNYYLKPGEDVKSLASNTPNAQYDMFNKSHLRRIGAALGLPYQFLMLDFEEGSFSSSRAALLQTYRTFTGWQEWLTTKFNQRVWNWRIAKAMKAGEISKAPVVQGVSQWYKVEWSFPEFGWIDPQNEAQANLLEWQLSTNTVTAMNRKKGRDVEDVMAEKGSEIAIAERTARAVNAQHEGMELTWRDIISAQIPGQAAGAGKKEKQQEFDPKGDISTWLE